MRKKKNPRKPLFKKAYEGSNTGAMYGFRTRDNWNHNPVLYQLS